MEHVLYCVVFYCALLTIPAKTDTVQDFVAGSKKFTEAIYKKTAELNQGNLILSPFSIETLLALISEGAEGKTREELVAKLFLPTSREKTQQAYKKLLKTIKSNDGSELLNANHIYTDINITLKKKFKKIAVDIYNSGVESVNFTDNVKAASTINQWVEEHTNHKIKDLIYSADISSKTSLIIVNAIYFKAAWKHEFFPRETCNQIFYNLGNDPVEVPTMHVTSLFNYYRNEELNAQFLELPYNGENLSMVIVLPNKKDGLERLEKDAEKILQPHPWTREDIEVSLPRFTIESTIQFVDILKSLGIEKIFRLQANFNGISSNPVKLYVSDVIQKAFINVSESGTEAAAATFEVESRINPLPFVVRHPFMYYIQKDGIVLFAGKITKI